MQSMRKGIVIGIDPDCEASGVAYIDNNYATCEVLAFPELIDKLLSFKDSDVRIFIEGGWLISANWHIKKGHNSHQASAIGNSVGRNHETGRKICEMLDHHNIQYFVRKPLLKRWQGQDGKITHKELCEVLQAAKIGFERKRTNQEERDALLLACVLADFDYRRNCSIFAESLDQ